MKKWSDDIQNRSLKLTVVGCGYVGLPTATLFADSGFNVTALDIKPEIVKTVNRKACPINEPGLRALLSRNVQFGRLKATLNFTDPINNSDVVIISVQTPIDKERQPNLSFLEQIIADLGRILKQEMLVVVISSVPPGTINGSVKPSLESLSGLKADSDFYLAYVPERISPGKALREFVENTRLVGGVGPNSTKIAVELFKTVCKNVVETDAATAEVAKLAENTFRDINIAFANQLALMCEQANVDVLDVIKLSNTHPRVHIHTPGPGVGGPCLTKDPYLLSYPFKMKCAIIDKARQANDYMPKHVTDLIFKAFKKTGKAIGASRIAVLGTAYKADVDDSRLSPAEPIIKELIKLGVTTTVYDPYCKEAFGANRTRNIMEAVSDVDCIVIVTNHSDFKRLDLEEIKKLMKNKPIIIDGRRIVNQKDAENLGFTYYGVGSKQNGSD